MPYVSTLLNLNLEATEHADHYRGNQKWSFKRDPRREIGQETK